MENKQPRDGRADFDFLHGHWTIRNRRLAQRLASSSDWQEFESTASVRPILGGLGNTDSIVTNDMPGTGAFEGFTVRLFDPRRRVWSIHWASTLAPGRLDPPLTGSFDGPHGVFQGHDTFDGRQIRVRFEWDAGNGSSARWQQAFSIDDGKTYEVNWVMEFERLGEP